MTKWLASAIVCAALFLHQAAGAGECACREICATADFGAMDVSGDWEDWFGSGRGMGGSLGIALARQLSVGFEGTFHDCEPNPDYLSEAYTYADYGWAMYTASIFAEYQVADSRLAPFVGGQFGVHFTHTDFQEVATGRVSSMGDHGLGYGVSAGLRYRMHGPWGLVMRARAERTPGLASGLRTSLHAGVSLYM